ncbi:sugar porter family MFS transporter [Kocuria tytonis]|uniref:Sugar porter family MFS transporter n=1 Tax=Kocuria tytonis TaxID=2054280 RepID=A0A495ABL4_9MICC|nr:sugar porter family MFS transporter [Kocuria tytonis]RKQ36864.1 sugar porter family MFS transporter [Kocuria tytonis]
MSDRTEPAGRAAAAAAPTAGSPGPEEPGTKHKRNIAIWFFGALGGILWGYDTGVIGGALLFIPEHIIPTPLIEGMVVSGLLLGAMVGALGSGRLADRLGRKKLIFAGGVVFVIGTAGAALAVSSFMLILFRFVIGVGVGIVSVIVPMYLSELAPKNIRGGLSSLMQLMVTTGIFLAYVVDLAFQGAGLWRWMIGLGAVPAIILMIGIMTQPESPRWLVAAHRGEKPAYTTLLRLRGNHTEAERELNEIRASVAAEEADEDPIALKDLLGSRLRILLVIGVLLVFFQNFGGINTIIYYCPTLLANIGFNPQQSLLANAAIGLLNMLMTLPAIKLIDRIGRKKLLVIGASGMCFGMLFLGTMTVLGLTTRQGPLAMTVTLAGIAIYIASFSLSWGPVQWVMLPELFPQRIRSGAMGMTTTLNWLFNLTVALVFPIFLARFGAAPNFFFFALMTFLALMFAWRLLPETKGKSLEEIEAQLTGRIPAVPAGGTAGASDR